MRLFNPEIKTTTNPVSCSPSLMSINHNFNWYQLKTFNYKLSEIHPCHQY